MTVISFITDPKIVNKILTHLGLPTSQPAIAGARPLDVDTPELAFGDCTDTYHPARPSATAARSPPQADYPVDADPPTDDDSGFWGA